VRRAKEGVRGKLPLQRPPEGCIYKRETSDAVRLEAIHVAAARGSKKRDIWLVFIYTHIQLLSPDV